MNILDPNQISNYTSIVASLLDIAKNIVDSRGRPDSGKLAELQRLVVDAQTATISFQQGYASLIQAKQKLEQKVAKLEAWDEDKINYELKQLFPGVYAHRYAPLTEPAKEDHWLCANCYNKGNCSILHRDHSSNQPAAICHGCGIRFVGPAPPPGQARVMR
jgi:hypothetical protein